MAHSDILRADALGGGGSGVRIPYLRTTLLTSSVSELALVTCSAAVACANGFSICRGDPRVPLPAGHILQVAFDNSCRASWIYPSSTERPWDLPHMFANQLTKIHL